MKARLTTAIVGGKINLRIGDVVEAAVAEELVSVGFAVALEEPKKAPAKAKADKD